MATTIPTGFPTTDNTGVPPGVTLGGIQLHGGVRSDVTIRHTLRF
jgi:hypothetical protein